jgi:hypothetical protein
VLCARERLCAKSYGPIRACTSAKLFRCRAMLVAAGPAARLTPKARGRLVSPFTLIFSSRSRCPLPAEGARILFAMLCSQCYAYFNRRPIWRSKSPMTLTNFVNPYFSRPFRARRNSVRFERFGWLSCAMKATASHPDKLITTRQRPCPTGKSSEAPMSTAALQRVWERINHGQSCYWNER